MFPVWPGGILQKLEYPESAEWELASKVKCPVMLLLGASDKMTPVKGAQKLQLAVANCQIKILPGVGHMMMLEEPRQTLKFIASFLNEAL